MSRARPRPRLQRDVAKGAVSLVPVERVPDRAFACKELLDGIPVDEINVEPAVVVVVEQGHSAADRLDENVVRRTTHETEFDPRFGWHPPELDRA